MIVTRFGAETRHLVSVFALCTYAHAAFYRRPRDMASALVDRFERRSPESIGF